MKCRCYPSLPADWEQAQFSDLAVVNPRYRVTKDREYPFVEMASVSEGFGGILHFDQRKPESSGLSKFAKHDTIFGKITPCAENGKIAYVCELPDEIGLGSTEFIVLSPKPDCDPRYLYAVTCSQPVYGRAISRMEGSTGRLRVTEDTFTRWLTVPKPPPDEQAAIAHILDSVDCAIEATRIAIDKAQRVRKALMQRLLSCGIGEDGKMRNQESAPERFCKTILGVLPSKWEIVPMASVGRWLSGGTPSKANPMFWRGDIPWVSPKDMKIEKLADVIDHISPAALKAGSNLAPANSVLIVVRGMILVHTVPVAVTLRPMAFNQDLKAIVCNDAVYPPYLLYWLLCNERRLLTLVTDSSHGTKRIDLRQLQRSFFARPDIDEQKKIVHILDNAALAINAKQTTLERLLRLKHGLMQDLLTGKVRTVKADTITQPAASREPVGTGS